MPTHFSQAQTNERSSLAPKDIKIMLKLAEILMKDNLISPEEKLRLTERIRKEDAL